MDRWDCKAVQLQRGPKELESSLAGAVMKGIDENSDGDVLCRKLTACRTIR